MEIKQILRKVRAGIFNYYAKYVFFLSTRRANANTFLNLSLNEKLKDGHIDLITVAFNSEVLINKQIDLLRTHLKEKEFTHIIIDNSTFRGKRKNIKEICIQKGVSYAPVPLFINRLISTRLFNHGISHGAAINWAFYNIVSYRKPSFFGTLDHDILLTGEYSISDKFRNQDFYGIKRDRIMGWYLWPGFSFLKFDILNGLDINFLPYQIKNTYLDAGGANYLSLYKNYNLNNIKFADDKLIRIQETKGLNNYNDIFHTDCIVRIDEIWVHIINGSNYTKQEGKDIMMEKVLNRF